MKIKLIFDASKPIAGEASTIVNRTPNEVFEFIADRFWDNYPRWAPDVVELTPLDGPEMFQGARGKQVRQDSDAIVESAFEVMEYVPCTRFVFQGASPPYKNTYISEGDASKAQTTLTFRFELLEIDIFMRPFVKLIRVAIEDGAEATVENIKDLLASTQSKSA
jgi:hypothetical protein